MTIQASIENQISDALRARDEVRLRTLRSLFAAMTNEAIAKHTSSIGQLPTFSERVTGSHDRFLTDEEALIVIRHAANQRKDSIQQFEKARRFDLSENEKVELAIIETYLPPLMTREEIEEAGHAKMKELGLSLRADSSTLISALMREFKGKVDGRDVKAVVDSLLSL